MTRQFTSKTVLIAGAMLLGAATMPMTAQAAKAGAKPDLSGVWENGSGIAFVVPVKSADGSICIAACVTPVSNPRPAAAAAPAPRPAPNVPKYKAEYVAKVKDLAQRQVLTDPVLRCQNPGLPRIGPPDKIVQTPSQLVFLYDDVSGAFWKIVPFSNTHREDAEETSLGDGIAHWEGATLVVESTKFNDSTWLTDNGALHSTALKVTERFTRKGDEIDYRATAEDPKVLTEPWKLDARKLTLNKTELYEPAPCVEQSIAAMVDPLAQEAGAYHTNPR
ncbi:MAG: hypothetical protein ABIO39_00285 [Caulobacteraceae bacterium]